VENVKKKIRVLSSIVLLILGTITFVILKFAFDFLEYVPEESILAMLTITAALVMTSFCVFRKISGNAIFEIERYSGKLHSILTTTRETRETLYTDLLLEKIMEVSTELTGAESGAIMFAEGDSLVLKVAKGTGKPRPVGLTIPKTQGVAGLVASTGTPLIANDAGPYGCEAGNVLCVPLKVRSDVIGALEVMNKKEAPFNYEDEELLSYFADHAAVSLKMARLCEDAKNFQIHLTNILIDAMENFVPEKRGHSKRVAKYALAVADAMGMTEAGKKRLYNASLLHDIGFLRIRHEGPRPPDYRAHPAVASEMLEPINIFSDITDIILHHHERYDGKGYPHGLSGEAIPVESRIIAIAEAFDAMMSKDSYKKIGRVYEDSDFPFTDGYLDAVEEIRKNSGTQFDPGLADVFLESVMESFLGEIPAASR
jgi:HD-GYP domain-containing protein (c-di-GMP phosphodiesterase class II)